jgi:acyl transferase domain-containing protein/acyl carrier protein
MQAAVLGLARVIEAEMPELDCVCIDLDPDPGMSSGVNADADAEVIIRETFDCADRASWGGVHREQAVCMRNGRRFVGRIDRIHHSFARSDTGVAVVVAAAAAAAASSGEGLCAGTYVVTGGVGGLGMVFCGWLARRGAKRVVLIGRREPAESARAMMAQVMSETGAEVGFASADVASGERVRAVLGAAAASGELCGVMHCAGIVDDAAIARQDSERVRRVFAPKVAGSWNLHEVASGPGVNMFVLFSSVSALLGSFGQANYAAANAFMDGLARMRVHNGQAGLSVRWGAWAEVGMATAAVTLRGLEQGGHIALAPAVGIQCLEHLLQRQLGERVTPADPGVFDVRWERMLERLPRPQALLARMAAAVQQQQCQATTTCATTAPRAMSALVAALSKKSEGDAQHAVLDVVFAVVKAVLGTDDVDADQPLTAAGMDSLLAVELRNALQREAGVALPATVGYDHPTVRAIAAHLVGLLAKKAAGTGAPGRLEPAKPLAAAAAAAAAVATSRGGSDWGKRVAIIGAGCRLPGRANSAEEFWVHVCRGQCGVTEFPESRFEWRHLYDGQDIGAAGKTYVKRAAFVDGVEMFDAAFFGITPAEASVMDPQQRMLLEVAHEAFETAGVPTTSVQGTAVGVYVGCYTGEYGSVASHVTSPYVVTGTVQNAVAGRVSYTFGLAGPGVAIDTACSSSLVATSLAVDSLTKGDCGMTLIGGTQANLSPWAFVVLCQMRALAPDGLCKTFDASADGYGRGEGVVAVVAMRLADAVAEGRHVMAVVHGAAVNHDGRSSGFTTPNGPAQSMAYRRALELSKLRPHDVGLIEAHGTGTSLGDPIEMQSLAAVYSEGRRWNRGTVEHMPETGPLVVASVKTNIGHLEGAAGITGLLKVVMSLQHGAIGPHLHLRRLNPHMPELETMGVVIPRVALAWRRLRPDTAGARAGAGENATSGGRARIAGVSSFGMSGTNAHVIVGEAPEQMEAGAVAFGWQQEDRKATVQSCSREHLVVLSAKSEGALRELARRYAAHIGRAVADDSEGSSSSSSSSDIEVGASCAAIALCRAHMQPHRAAVVGAGREALQARLSEVAGGGGGGGADAGGRAAAAEAETITAPRRLAARGSGVAFLFTGQGSQYAGMGRELYETDDVFRRVVDTCARVLDPLLVEEAGGAVGESLIGSVLYPPQPPRSLPCAVTISAASASSKAKSGGDDGDGIESRTVSGLIDRTRYAQPALFVVEYALAELWASLGVVPAYALGHSVGELAAACVAGVFGLEDGLRLVEARGRLMGTLEMVAPASTSAAGVMAAVSVSEERVCAAMATLPTALRERVSLAAVNGPQQVVMSGERAAVDEVIAALEAQALASPAAAAAAAATTTTTAAAAAAVPVRWQMLRVSNAFHSHLMEPMLDEFERVAAGVQFSRPSAHVRLASNVTGALVIGTVDDGTCSSARYWRQHVRGTVRFDAAVRSVAAAGCRAFIEVGPHPVLLGLAAASLEDLHDEQLQPSQSSLSRTQLLLLASLRRDVPAWHTMLESVGRVFADGAIDIEFRRLFGTFDGPAVTSAVAALPTYPFQRKRHWASGKAGDRLWPSGYVWPGQSVSFTTTSSSSSSDEEQQRQGIAGLLYEVVWEEKKDAHEATMVVATCSGGTAVVLAEAEATTVKSGCGTGKAVAARLLRTGAERVVVVRAGAECTCNVEEAAAARVCLEAVVRVGEAGDMARALSCCSGSGGNSGVNRLTAVV